MLPESVLIKGLGSLAGTILALVFIVPKTVSGFIRRTVASLIGGIVFGPVIHVYLAWPTVWEHLVASSAIASFLSWWVMGPIVTVARKWLTDKTQSE